MEGANDRSKYMCFMINRFSLWGSNARSGPSEINVSASEAVFMFFGVFFRTTFVDRQIKIKAHKKVPKHAQFKSALSKCTYRFNKPNRLMTIIISRVINLFSIFVFDILGFHMITFWVNFRDEMRGKWAVLLSNCASRHVTLYRFH